MRAMLTVWKGESNHWKLLTVLDIRTVSNWYVLPRLSLIKRDMTKITIVLAVQLKLTSAVGEGGEGREERGRGPSSVHNKLCGDLINCVMT